MKAAIFDPYLDTIGGGEVYTSSVAECLMKEGYRVDLFWNDKQITEKIRKFLGIDITKAHVNALGYWLYTNRGSLLQKRNLTGDYDLIFFVSDGSIPLLFSRKNILHFQIPFKHIGGRSLANRLKLQKIHQVVCNSQFTKSVIDREFGIGSQVIYPPINIQVRSVGKQNIILSVGRFTQTLHNKRQDVLVEAFRELVEEGLKDWELVLVGSSKEGEEILKGLKNQAKGYPISILSDVEHSRLEKEYARAKLFWHAAGYQVDEDQNPELVEHFGIATAEAMASGCIPIVISKGGQPEIVKNGENGYLWNSLDSLKKNTLQLIRSPEKAKMMSQKAKKASRRFTKDRFCKHLRSFVSV